MRRLARSLSASLRVGAVLLCGTLAAAAVTVSGRVVDENGTPVTGARISVVSGEAASEATSSDAAGLFHLQLAAQGRYELRAEHEGFFLFKSPAIDLAVTAPLEIHMNHLKELAESVDVRFSQPVIDPQQTSDTRRVNAPDILNVPRPVPQDFRNALPMMPGVVQASDGQAHFNGAATSQTNYRLDGFDVSDPGSRTLTARLSVDAIQTLEWDAARIAPEKGTGSAGALEIRTEMGDDHWRFAAANLFPGISTDGGLHLHHWSPRALISGPIRRNKAWFHSAFDAYYVASTVVGLPKGENRATSVTGSNLTRLQWNITDRQILSASLLTNRGNSGRSGLSFLNPIETTLNNRQSLVVGTVKDQFLWGSGLLEIGFAATSGGFHASPQGTLPYVVTPFGATGNFLRDQRVNSGRQEWLANGVMKPFSWYGTHQLEAGANVQRSSLDEWTMRHDLSVVRTDGSLVRQVSFQGSPREFLTSIEEYSYALDRWSPVAGLVVEGALRYQWDKYIKGATPAPAISAAWAPAMLHGLKLSAGWGIYFDPVPLRTLALNQEQSSITTLFAPSGAPAGVPIESRFRFNRSDVRIPRFAVSSFSLEDLLPGHVYAKLSLTSREGSRGLSFAPVSSTLSTNDYVLENIDRQRYRSAEVSLRKTFLARYQWFGSYVRSQAHSTAVLTYSIENPLFAAQAGGPLPWDAPNRFMTWGWMPISKTWFPGFLRPVVGETDFQLLGEYRSGFPFSSTNEVGQLVGLPDRLRFPAYCSLNIALERKFPFRGYVVAVRGGVVNALNRQNPNVVNSDFDSPDFMKFGGGQSRAFNVRLRFVGRK